VKNLFSNSKADERFIVYVVNDSIKLIVINFEQHKGKYSLPVYL
jgi:hypothetical protein